VHVVPHVQSTEMQYRRKADFSLGARVEVFLRNSSQSVQEIPATTDIRVRGQTPEALLTEDAWAWHDFPSAWGGAPLRLPPGAMTVWSWNGKRAPWGVQTAAELTIGLPGVGSPVRLDVAIDRPKVWLSAVTFLGPGDRVNPDSVLVHVANHSGAPLTLDGLRLWWPDDRADWRVLRPRAWLEGGALERFPVDGILPDGQRGGARASTGPLPLTYAAIEVRLRGAGGKT
jgi:hypothetical protein